MTQTRSSLVCSLFTVLAALALGGCATAGASGKTQAANSSGDAAQLTSPDNPTASEPLDHSPAASEFSQPPTGAPTPESQTAPEQAGSSRSSEYHETSPAAAQPASGSTLHRSPQLDESTSPLPSRSRGVAKSAPPVRKSVERPGLATVWGETRESRVTTTSFTRASNHPWSVLRIQYDDQNGILARAGLSSTDALSSNLVATPSGFVTVEVVDDVGNPLAGLAEGSRSFVIGHYGDRYGIRISNRSSERFEIVATVDGLDVLDGRPGSFLKRGYLIEANSSLEIDGFRRSTTEVAAFRFGSVKDSYAARTSGDNNVGVIGIAVFREYRRLDPDRFEENRRRDNADPFPQRFAAPPPAPVPVIRN